MLIIGVQVGTFFGTIFGLLRSEELHSKAKTESRKIISYKSHCYESVNANNALDITFGTIAAETVADHAFEVCSSSYSHHTNSPLFTSPTINTV